jgi:hypothetical protein
MRLLLETQRDDTAAAALAEQLLATVVAAASDPQHVVPAYLERMPWFAIVVRFLTTRLDDGDERRLRRLFRFSSE